MIKTAIENKNTSCIYVFFVRIRIKEQCGKYVRRFFGHVSRPK